MTYKEEINKLNYDNTEFDDLVVDLCTDVDDIILRYFAQRNEIIDALPEKLKMIYLVGDFESQVHNDGLMSIFYNGDLLEFNRYRAAFTALGLTEVLGIVDDANALVARKFQLGEINFWDTYPSVNMEKFFGEAILERVNDLEEKFLDMEGAYWDDIEDYYNS